jgi:hypothetical protein
MMVAGESAPVLCRYAHGTSTGLNHTHQLLIMWYCPSQYEQNQETGGKSIAKYGMSDHGQN